MRCPLQVVKRAPCVEKVVAREALLPQGIQTIKIDVYVRFRSQTEKVFSYFVPQNNATTEQPDYML